MWLELLELCTPLQDECCFRHLRAQEFTQDKTRREEDTSLSLSLTNLVKVLYSEKSILTSYFKDLSTPFIIERAGHKCTKEGSLKGHLLISFKTI